MDFLKKGIKEKLIKNFPLDYISAISFSQIVSTTNYLVLTESKDSKLIEKMVVFMMDFFKT